MTGYRDAYRYIYRYHTNNPDEPMCYVHYSDSDWYGVDGRAIYGDPKADHDGGDYSDRLVGYVSSEVVAQIIERDGVDEDEARRRAVHEAYQRYPKVAGRGDGMSANRLGSILSDILGYRVAVTAVIAGIQRFDGYPWFYYQWRKVGQ